MVISQKIKEAIQLLESKKDKKSLVLLAADIADTVIYIYEEKFPEDNAPKEAIKAARDYVNNKIDRNTLVEKSEAAWSSRINYYRIEEEIEQEALQNNYDKYLIHRLKSEKVYHLTHSLYAAARTSTAAKTSNFPGTVNQAFDIVREATWAEALRAGKRTRTGFDEEGLKAYNKKMSEIGEIILKYI